MLARDLMSSPVVTASPEMTVGEAADVMLANNISSLPILDGHGKLVGIVTQSDYGLHLKHLPLADGLYTVLGQMVTAPHLEEATAKLRDRPVKEIMNYPVVTVKEEQTAAGVAEAMLRHKVDRMPVMRGDQVVGIVSRHDLLKIIARGQPKA